MKNGSFVVSVTAGIILFALFFSAAGFLVRHLKVWPYSQLVEAKDILTSLLTYEELVPEGRRHRAPEGASREFATLHDAEASIGSGHYALLGWDNSRAAYSVFLYDASGALSHTWPIDDMAFWKDSEERKYAPHAMEVLTDGTILVSADAIGRFSRFDACGDAIWTKSGHHHHSFSPASDGGIWTTYGAETAYGEIHDILKFDPFTGDDMVRISLNDDVIMKSDDSALIFSMFPDYAFTPDSDDPEDIFHPNDVEELMPEMAQAFPQFDAGDLMLSLRELNMVVIISQAGEIKWHQQGPWLRQHDPDFEPDGRISIYNNSVLRPRSSILTIDPKSGDLTNAIPEFAGAFKSETMGKHQLLPNGNRLIMIPKQGQTLEVAPDGSVVMEFNNVVPGMENFNDDLANAKWLPEGFFETEPNCTK